MKKFLYILLMAVLAIPTMQAVERPAAPFALRGQAKVVGTKIKGNDFSMISNYAMTKGENAITWDFEDEAQLDDWMALDNDGDGFGWTYHFNTGTGNFTTHSGDGLVYSESYHNNENGQGGTVLYPDNWLISPVVPLGGGLSLWACGQDASYAAEVFAIYVCVGTPSSIYDFVKIGEDITATGDMTEYSFDLSAYAGQEGCFAIRHYNVSDQFVLNIDDITIDPDLVVIPDPTTPTDLSVEPGPTTADVIWADNDDNAWNLRYRVYDPNMAMTYHWSAEADENLDDWMIWDADGDGYNWGISAYSYAPDGNNIFYSASYADYSPLDPENWLITPEVKMGGTLTFWAASYMDWFPDNFSVYLIPDVDDEATWVEIIPSTTATEEGDYYTVDLSNYEGTARIGFLHADSYNQYYLFVDDITVEVPGNPEGEWTYVYDLTNTNYTIEGLDPETTYEVQVQAYNENQAESDWTESVIFTTTQKTSIEEISAEVKGDNRYYNMMGQEVDGNNLPAGIYIHNGKKILVK